MTGVKRSIPNIISLLNLSCGVLSLYFSSQEAGMVAAAWLILLAMVFDFLDGFAARLLKAYSAVGKELDSLSDLVSFGVAPALLLMQSLKTELFTGDPILMQYLAYSLLLIPALSALRLARFNMDERQHSHFIGLPTPANALLLVSLFMLQWQIHLPAGLSLLQGNAIAVCAVSLFAALLLNSALPMFSMKPDFRNTALTLLQSSVLLIGIAGFAAAGFAAIPFVMLVYGLAGSVFRKVYLKAGV